MLEPPVRGKRRGDQVGKWLTQEAIEWHFQPPRAPPFRSCARKLGEIDKNSPIPDSGQREEGRASFFSRNLTTLLFEVAGILNSRPLGYASSDPKDFRPLHLHDILNRPPVASNEPEGYLDEPPSERYPYVQKIANLFWDMGKKTYIQSMIERKGLRKKIRNLAVGDLVLLVEKNLSRGQWCTGRVKKTYTGTDELIRVVDVESKGGIFRRTVHTPCYLGSPDENEEQPPKSGRLVRGGGHIPARTVNNM